MPLGVYRCVIQGVTPLTYLVGQLLHVCPLEAAIGYCHIIAVPQKLTTINSL